MLQQPNSQDDPLESEQPASPEEQAIYDMVVYKAMAWLYDKKTNGAQLTLDVLKSAASPGEGIAKSAANLVRSIEMAARSAGKRIPGDLLFHAGADVVSQIREFGERNNVWEGVPEEQLDREEQRGFFEALRMYGEQELENGDVTPQDAQAELAELNQMYGGDVQPTQPVQPATQQQAPAQPAMPSTIQRGAMPQIEAPGVAPAPSAAPLPSRSSQRATPGLILDQV
jgi:hypothetical protein